MQSTSTNQSSDPHVERISPFHRRIHTEIIINAPAETVWHVLTDWDRLGEWSPTLMGMRGEIRHGHEVECEYRFRGSVIKPKHTLHFEEGREFGWSDPMLPGVVDRHRYRVEALPDGRTRFVQSDEVRGGLLSLLFGWLFMREMVTSYPAFNHALKQRVEGQRTGHEAALFT